MYLGFDCAKNRVIKYTNAVFDWNFAGSSGVGQTGQMTTSTTEPSAERTYDGSHYATRLRDAVPSAPAILPGPSWLPSMGRPPRHPHRMRKLRTHQSSASSSSVALSSSSSSSSSASSSQSQLSLVTG